MKVLLVGAGAVGAYFGGRLAQAGAEVSVVVRSHWERIVQNGYQIDSVDGNFCFRPSQVLRSMKEYTDTPDWVIVATKVLPEIDLPVILRGALASKHTAVLLIQNGIGIEEPLLAAFPEHEIYSAVAYIGVTRIDPCHLNHQGVHRLIFGRCDGQPPSEKAAGLAQAWCSVGVEARAVDDIRYFRWKKLLWNTPFNPVSVIGGGLNTRELTDGGEIEALCADIMAEVAAVAAAEGVKLEPELLEETMVYTRSFPPYKTSMLVDFEAGRPMEVEAIVGNVLRRARCHGVETPKLQAIYALLGALNRRNLRG